MEVRHPDVDLLKFEKIKIIVPKKNVEKIIKHILDNKGIIENDQLNKLIELSE